MLDRLILKAKYPEILLLIAFTFFCLSLSIARIVYTGELRYIFLNWNLFLAFIPWFITSFFIADKSVSKSSFSTFLVIIVWLLFFPNAPYILTDLFHLSFNSGAPVWFDLILILSFAWTGLLFGFISLVDIEKILASKMKKYKVVVLLSFLLFLTGFGIYMGRYLRWNSWDIIVEPYLLVADVLSRFLDSLDHPRSWGMTILMGLFLNMVYWSFRVLRRRSY